MKATPQAERVIVIMGSGAETVQETVDELSAPRRKSRRAESPLVPPVLRDAFLATLPKTVTSIAVLDRTKEPGAPGDPLYLDVVTALAQARAW